MGAKLKIDWELGRALYLQGLCLSEISAKLGCNGSTLRSVVMRQRWKQVAEQSKQIVRQMSLQERATDWQTRVGNLIERHLTKLESIDPAKLKLHHLEVLSGVIDRVDKVGRRTFNLDVEGAGRTLVGLRKTITIINSPPVETQAQAEPIEG